MNFVLRAGLNRIKKVYCHKKFGLSGKSCDQDNFYLVYFSNLYLLKGTPELP